MHITEGPNSPKALNSENDERLLERISLNRDKQALAELYDRYRHSLGSFLRRKIYQEKLVDEVYNDVMLTIWQKADGFRGESKVSTWIFGMAYRVCLTHARREMKHTRNMAEVEFDDMQAKPDKAEVNPVIEQLRSATMKLNDKHREVIELSYFHGHSLSEIAEIVGCPENTVKTRLFHARQRLKTNIEKQAVA